MKEGGLRETAECHLQLSAPQKRPFNHRRRLCKEIKDAFCFRLHRRRRRQLLNWNTGLGLGLGPELRDLVNI